MAAMLEHANLVITAWDGSLLAGVSRCVTGFSYSTDLSDLAVRVSHQRTVILPSAPKAIDYYPRIGFTQHNSAWILTPDYRF